jgi:hypothetical protein
VRLCWIEDLASGLEEGDCHSVRSLTAAHPDAFEARNGLFDRRSASNGKPDRLCRGVSLKQVSAGMVDVDNESNQVS